MLDAGLQARRELEIPVGRADDDQIGCGKRARGREQRIVQPAGGNQSLARLERFSGQRRKAQCVQVYRFRFRLRLQPRIWLWLQPSVSGPLHAPS